MLCITGADASALQELRAFIYAQHVEASSFSPESRAAQIADLDADFPDLATVGLADDAGKHLRRGAWLCRADSGSIVAAIGLKACASRARALDISFLFVDPFYRRRGLARSLLNTALAAAAAEEGVEAVRLLTLERTYDAAIALYTSVGFRAYERSEPNAACPHYTLLRMQLDDLAPWRAGDRVTVEAAAIAL